MADKNKNKQKQKKEAISPEAIALGQKRVDNILKSQNLEQLVGSNQYLDAINDSYEQGKGYYNPSLRKNLGSLFYEDPAVFSETGEDVVLDHFQNYNDKANKALVQKVAENLDELIEEADTKKLLGYLYHVQPAKNISEKYKDLASVHKDLIALSSAGKDADSMRDYLSNYYKKDALLSYWVNGSDESAKKIYDKTLQLKQLELNAALTKTVDKDGKKETVLDEEKLRGYVAECIKGADDKIKPHLYKDLAYSVVQGKK